MTENEAIEELREQIETAESMISFNMDFEPKHDNSVLENKIKTAKIAISALEEIQQYRAIDTIEECREAREKQRAKKPNGRYKTRHMWDGAYCPMCRCGITARWNFCQSCGQAIDWSETV